MNDAAITAPVAASGSRRILSLRAFMNAMQRVIVPMLTLIFIGFTLFYAGTAIIEFLSPILYQGDVVEGLVKGLNMGVVALAVYELAQIVYEEYEEVEPRDGRVVRMRRGIIRFVSVTCTALVLESLIMVIKYSQKDLAGFLFYPVAIVTAAAVLLVSLGVFARLTRGDEDSGAAGAPRRGADLKPVRSPSPAREQGEW
jgi:hypothetical protein